MRVLIATGIYPPSIGGPATYSKILYENLHKYGISVAVASFDNLRHLPIGIRHFLYFIKLLIDGIGCDVIYAQDPVSVGYPAMWAARILNKKFVLKIVGDYAWEQGVQRFGVKELLDDFVKDRREYHSRVLQMKKIQKKVAKSADKIIVPSRYLKKIVTQWGIEENKINVVYNSFEGILDIEKIIKNDLGLSHPTIISAGRLVPWKGFEKLINVISELKEKIPSIKLIIIGDGPQKQNLEKIIVDKKLSQNVSLLPAMSKENLFEYIHSSDIFVLNTGYEGFSHQILEVLALGVPIITTNIGGNPEIIKNEENGILVDYDDVEQIKSAINKILNDRSFSGMISENGKKSVAEFSLNKMLGEISTELKSTI